MKTPNFPVEVKKGNSTVKIYQHRNAGYDEFKVAYYAEGRRKMETFADYQDARERADEINDTVNKGDVDVLTLTGTDRLIYGRATASVKPTGIALDIAAAQFAEIVSILGNVAPVEAARFYRNRHPATLPKLTVTQAVDEFIAGKTAAGRSNRHVEDLTYRLGQFKDSFQCQLADVQESHLKLFLDGLRDKKGNELAARSRNNFHAAIVSFFRWAVKKKYLPTDWNEFAAIETVDDDGGEVGIFTPEELAALLIHAGADEYKALIPFLVIGAFAGLRSSEIVRLDWKQVGVSNSKFIELKSSVARKTRQRRLVPISDNLAVWLADCRKAKGAVWPCHPDHLYRLLSGLSEKAGVTWKQNALRHSFITYRVAQTQDAQKVALEAGNSPAKIFRHYLELVTPEEATRWFSIKPDASAAGKVIWLKAA